MSSDDESRASNRNGALSDVDDNLEDEDLQGDMDDLFGDDDDEPQRDTRQLDDIDLDSGDDEGRTDRLQMDDEEEDAVEQQELTVQTIQMPRHVVPEPSDNEIYLTKVPTFLSIQPTAYKLQTFQPPVTDHHSKLPPSEGFNAYQTAITTVRWRHSPSDPSELQSNARILRWSDGSMTLQLATNPTQQYEILAAPLAPPQKNPPKPTPTSSMGRRKDSTKDSFQYLASASRNMYGARITNHITTSLQIKPSASKSVKEDLEAEMQAIMANYQSENQGVQVAQLNIDYEKKTQEALRQEKEEDRKIRKLQRDQEKRANLGGVRSGRAGGLTLDALEGESRPRQSRPKQRRGAQRDQLSDEEEEMYGRRGGPEDQYDMEDDFLVDSEEDLEGESDEDAEGSEDIDAVIERQERNERKQSPKRPRADDEDATNPQGSPLSRHKRRRVVSDDDDE